MNMTTTDATILRIRASLGALTEDRCPTCGCPAASPYRRYNAAGDVVEGCVDAHHSQAPSPDGWHTHWAAQEIRNASLAFLQTGV